MLTNQQVPFLIDSKDYDKVIQHSWFFSMRRKPTSKSSGHGVLASKIKQKTITLHRFILNSPQGAIVDHINRDTTDNRRCNLRHVTLSQNSLNSNKRKSSKSKYKNVTWHKHVEQWQARLTINGTREHLGYYQTAEEAHEVLKNRGMM